MTDPIKHQGHGEGAAMFIGHVSGCPACESNREASRQIILDEAIQEFFSRMSGEKADAADVDELVEAFHAAVTAMSACIEETGSWGVDALDKARRALALYEAYNSK